MIRFGRYVQEELKRIFFNLKNLTLIIAFAAVSTFTPSYVLYSTLIEMNQKTNIPLIEIFESFTKLFSFSYTLSTSLLVIFGLAIDSYLSDKKEGVIEATLASPASENLIWLGKSTSLTIASLSCVWLSIIFYVPGYNYLLRKFDAASSWIFPYSSEQLFYIFFLLPVLVILISLFSGVFQLTTKHYSSINFVFFLIGFVYLFASSIYFDSLVMLSDKKILMGMFVIFLSLLFCTLLFRYLFLNKERMVLSR